MSAVELASARVIRHGTALAVALASGGEHVIRLIDIGRVLGEVIPPGRRIVGAQLDASRAGTTLVLAFADGAGETLSSTHLAELCDYPAGRAGSTRRADLVITGVGLLLTGEGDPTNPLGLIADAALIAGGGRILWVGPAAELDSRFRGRLSYDLSAAAWVNAGGRLVTPGLVDCHAHPLFAGNRADEFSRRSEGQTYQEIAAAGGGIAATLRPTRAASVDEHIALTVGRMARALAAGTTTCEAKSGYDLTASGELRLLEIAWAADALQPVDLVPTLLGAHVIPPEYEGDRAGFVELVAGRMVPEAARLGLAGIVDVYCDQGAFTQGESRTILEAARRAGMQVRAHVGQFADIGGAEMIAELGGLSADHLEVVSETGIAALAAHGVVAVMLPGACVQLRMKPPPVPLLRRAGVAMALASDLNPGTSMCETLPVQMWLATTHYGMTVTEAWLGVTQVAARALGRHDIGVLTPGAHADVVIWNAEKPAEVPYHYGASAAAQVFKGGRHVWSAPGL